MLSKNNAFWSSFWLHFSISIQEKPRKFHFTDSEIWNVLFTWHINLKPSVSWHADYNIPRFKEIRRERILSAMLKKLKENGAAETVQMNKWPLHQENNGQSQLGDSWHTRSAPCHLSGAAVILFLILPLGVSTSLPFHYDTTNKQIRHYQTKRELKFETFLSIEATIL